MWLDFAWKVFLYFFERRKIVRKDTGLSISGDFMNYLRFNALESAAATFTEFELDTNLSAERGVMMEIHSIELSFDDLAYYREIAAGGSEQCAFQVTRTSQTTMVDLNNADCVAKFERETTRSAAIGTDAGPLWVTFDKQVSLWFPRPIPYVKPSIFVAVASTFASAANVAGRIGYTLREIDRSEFLELLVALQ
jgi:hypothetical protein